MRFCLGRKWTASLVLALAIAATGANLATAQPPDEGGIGTPMAALKPEVFARRNTNVPLAERLSEDPEARVLELIYVLRHYRVFSRDEEMAQAIRELHRIGKPAVPELVAELDRTDRDNTLRVLGIALRALNDPRAVPGLIRAVPKTLRPPGSDCGVSIEDPELLKFVLSFERGASPDQKHMSVGRPVNEISRALERITGHKSPGGDRDPLRGNFLGGPDTEAAQRKKYLDRQKYWAGWWAEHSGEFLPEAERQALDHPTAADAVPRDGRDRVDRAGEARFGAIFPTGPDVRLGPVHEVELFNILFADAPSAIDFERHRVFRFQEGLREEDRWHVQWMRRVGVDMIVGGDCDDLRLWVIDDARWETIDQEVLASEPLRPGYEHRGGFFQLEGARTVLFNTRDGGSGILQVEPYRGATASRKVRYRMWQMGPSAEDEPAPTPPVAEKDIEWSETIDVTLKPPEENAQCAWSLSRKQYAPLPRPFEAKELTQQMWSQEAETDLARWRREQAIDLLATPASERHPLQLRTDEKPDLLQIALFDGVARPVRTECFESLTAPAAKALLDEPAARPLQPVNILSSMGIPQPQTYLFRTSRGESGILQFRSGSLKAGLALLRYRLIEEAERPQMR